MEISLSSQWVTPANPHSHSLQAVFATLFVQATCFKLQRPITFNELSAAGNTFPSLTGLHDARFPTTSSAHSCLRALHGIPCLALSVRQPPKFAAWSPQVWPLAADFEAALSLCPMALVTTISPLGANGSLPPVLIGCQAHTQPLGPATQTTIGTWAFFLAIPTLSVYYPSLDSNSADLQDIRRAGHTIID